MDGGKLMQITECKLFLKWSIFQEGLRKGPARCSPVVSVVPVGSLCLAD